MCWGFEPHAQPRMEFLKHVSECDSFTGKWRHGWCINLAGLRSGSHVRANVKYMYRNVMLVSPVSARKVTTLGFLRVDTRGSSPLTHTHTGKYEFQHRWSIWWRVVALAAKCFLGWQFNSWKQFNSLIKYSNILAHNLPSLLLFSLGPDW